MATDTIISELCELDESPWGDIRGEPIDARGLAGLLKPYDIKPKVVRIGAATPRGYAREDLEWRRKWLDPVATLGYYMRMPSRDR